MEALIELAKSRLHSKIWNILISIYPKNKQNKPEVKFPLMELAYKIVNIVMEEITREPYAKNLKKGLTDYGYFAISLLMNQTEKDFLYCLQKADYYYKLSKRMLNIAKECLENAETETPQFKIKISKEVYKTLKRYFKPTSEIKVEEL